MSPTEFEAPKNGSLSEFFDDPWYKFTDDVMNPGLVANILNNSYAPANAPHQTSAATLEKACEDFLQDNGDELLRALDHLNCNK